MWVGIDLDGTLAYRDHSLSYDPMKIGKMIPKAKEMLMGLIEQGKRENFVVRIYTARACEERTFPVIQQWLKENEVPPLGITNVKDYECFLIIDDIASQVIPNTGILVSEYYLDLLKQRDDLLEKVLNEAITRDGVSLRTIEKVKTMLRGEK